MMLKFSLCQDYIIMPRSHTAKQLYDLIIKILHQQNFLVFIKSINFLFGYD